MISALPSNDFLTHGHSIQHKISHLGLEMIQVDAAPLRGEASDVAFELIQGKRQVARCTGRGFEPQPQQPLCARDRFRAQARCLKRMRKKSILF